MGNLTLSYKNFADTGTLSGGSWQTTLPVSNLQTRKLSQVARSLNATASSTQFRVDLGTDDYAVHLIGLFRHNFSVDATYRIVAGTSAGTSDVYDSGTLLVWPTVYLPEDLEWEDDNFWLGILSSADVESYPINLIHDNGENVRARYWTVFITDTTNSAGYVQAGRFWMGPAWTPTINYDYGAGLAWEPRSDSEYALGGNMFFDERSPARIFSFVLANLTETEAYGQMLDIQRILRNDKEVLLIPDPDDTARGFKRNFLGRMRRSDPITQTLFDRHSISMEVEELL